MAINSIFKGRIKKIHLIGIGGIGMSGIARILLESEFKVTGSDIRNGSQIESLQKKGAKIFIGHSASNIGDADVVVYSSAITRDNEEVKEAKQRNIALIPRAVMLAELMRLHCGIAVSGSHGKTTTTSLIGTVMHKLGFDPTVIIGGIVNHFGSNAVLGKSQFMITEADESDGTFLHLSPTIAVVTNIDKEHLDFYKGGLLEIQKRFIQFLNSVPFYGAIIACLDDHNVLSILHKLNKRVITYGLSDDALIKAKNIKYDGFKTNFDLVIKGEEVMPLQINMVGQHNVLNTLACIAVLKEIGAQSELLKIPLKSFNGIKRRFTPLYSSNEFTVIDDYAHHPTEILAVLRAARTSFANKKLRVLFQPHRYSRTKELLHEFTTCFNDCDSLVITDIFSASESPIDGINSKVIINNIKKSSALSPIHATDLNDGIEKITNMVEKNDVILTIGAGSISTAGSRIINCLKDKYDYA